MLGEESYSNTIVELVGSFHEQLKAMRRPPVPSQLHPATQLVAGYSPQMISFIVRSPYGFS
jgi:hypothetical protein